MGGERGEYETWIFQKKLEVSLLEEEERVEIRIHEGVSLKIGHTHMGH